MRALILLVAAALGCGGGPGSGPAETAPQAEPPRPKDAAQLAVALVGGRVSGLVWVDRVRGHAVGPRLMALGPVRELLEGTSVDPLSDVERAFFASPSASERRVVFFGEHRLDEARIEAAMQDLVAKSEPRGQRLHDLPFPAVKVRKDEFGGVIAFLPPRYVVAVPEDLVGGLTTFARTGGLPDPTGPEAARLVALDPGRSLRARGAPRIPETLSSSEATVVLHPDGGATIHARGQSTDPTQADLDARSLTQAIDDKTSVKLGILTIRAFRPIVFRSSGADVVGQLDLSRAEVGQLLGLAGTFLRK